VTAKHRRTAHTGQSTGSRRSRDKRMAASREKSGCTLPDTSATGRRTRRTDSASSSIKTATSTKDCGRKISAMVRELTGAMKLANCVASIQVTGTKIRNTVAALSSIRTATDTTATGSPECLKEKAE